MSMSLLLTCLCIILGCSMCTAFEMRLTPLNEDQNFAKVAILSEEEVKVVENRQWNFKPSQNQENDGYMFKLDMSPLWFNRTGFSKVDIQIYGGNGKSSSSSNSPQLDHLIISFMLTTGSAPQTTEPFRQHWFKNGISRKQCNISTMYKRGIFSISEYQRIYGKTN